MPNVRTTIAAAAGLLLSAAAVAFLATVIDLAATGRILATANGAPLVAAVGVLIVGVILRIARWRLLLPEHDGGGRVPFLRLAPPVLVGYLGNIVLPARLGEGVRAVAVWRRERIDLAGALGSVAVERVLDTAVVAILGFGAAVWLQAPIWFVSGTALIAAVAGGVLVILVSGMGSWAAARMTGAHARWPRVVGAADRFLRAASVPNRDALIEALVLTLTVWLLEALIIWLAAASLSIGLDLPQAMAIAAAGVLITAIPAAPGSLGTYELAASTVGTALGLTPEAALALAVLVHAVTIIPLTVAGVGTALALGMRLSTTQASSHPASPLPHSRPSVE